MVLVLVVYWASNLRPARGRAAQRHADGAGLRQHEAGRARDAAAFQGKPDDRAAVGAVHRDSVAAAAPASSNCSTGGWRCSCWRSCCWSSGRRRSRWRRSARRCAARTGSCSAWIAPRGIVAAATAGIFGPALVASGYPDAAKLLPVTFAVIIATVLAHGLSIGRLGRRLDLAARGDNGLLIVGATRLVDRAGEGAEEAGHRRAGRRRRLPAAEGCANGRHRRLLRRDPVRTCRTYARGPAPEPSAGVDRQRFLQRAGLQGARPRVSAITAPSSWRPTRPVGARNEAADAAAARLFRVRSGSQLRGAAAAACRNGWAVQTTRLSKSLRLGRICRRAAANRATTGCCSAAFRPAACCGCIRRNSASSSKPAGPRSSLLRKPRARRSRPGLARPDQVAARPAAARAAFVNRRSMAPPA